MKKILFSIAFLAISFANAQQTNTAAIAEKTFTVGKYTVKYAVDNRVASKLPKIDIMSADHGTIVIDINVDKYGNVTTATPNAAASDSKSTYLTTKAKQAAETTHFNTSPTTPLKTKGTMTFTF